MAATLIGRTCAATKKENRQQYARLSLFIYITTIKSLSAPLSRGNKRSKVSIIQSLGIILANQ
jgi:hypothetical protein